PAPPSPERQTSLRQPRLSASPPYLQPGPAFGLQLQFSLLSLKLLPQLLKLSQLLKWPPLPRAPSPQVLQALPLGAWPVLAVPAWQVRALPVQAQQVHSVLSLRIGAGAPPGDKPPTPWAVYPTHTD